MKSKRKGEPNAIVACARPARDDRRRGSPEAVTGGGGLLPIEAPGGASPSSAGISP